MNDTRRVKTIGVGEDNHDYKKVFYMGRGEKVKIGTHGKHVKKVLVSFGLDVW